MLYYKYTGIECHVHPPRLMTGFFRFLYIGSRKAPVFSLKYPLEKTIVFPLLSLIKILDLFDNSVMLSRTKVRQVLQIFGLALELKFGNLPFLNGSCSITEVIEQLY